MTAAPEPVVELVLLDQESADHDLTIRPSMFSDRVVVAVGWGDEDSGWTEAVALDRADVERARDWLTAWLEARS